jgi:glyoxylase-like metal-dependent hydrolase (beta-lactamase superfamily II)
MPEINIWDHGITQVKITMSKPLRWVNSYILPNSNGVAIIDPGPRNDTTEGEWRKVLNHLGYSIHDVNEIFVTHHHPDHFGLAGWFQSHSGCVVYMSQRAYDESQLMWGTNSNMNSEFTEWLRYHGLPLELAIQIDRHLIEFLPQVSPTPDITVVVGGSQIVLGGHSWLVIESGGHAPGHLSLFQQELGLMMCGDAVLPRISPNVSLIPGSDPEPLYTFMNSLHHLMQYKVSQVFPGHRDPFSTFHKRIEELLNHHEERLSKIENDLLHSPKSGYEICCMLFGKRLSPHQMRFAMCEALAHLQELVRQGKVRSLISPLDSNIMFTTDL